MENHTRESLSQMSVLVAEDDPIAREHIGTYLKRRFHKVYAVEDGEKALHLIEKHTVHIIILDIYMPLLNGMEVARILRKKDLDIPIIILTSHGEAEMLQEAVSLRLSGYILKPLRLGNLEEMLLRCVNEMHKRGRILTQLSNGATYNYVTQSVTKDGHKYALTKNEKRFLKIMLRNRNQLLSFDAICEAMDPNLEMTNCALRNLVYRLRKKIGAESIISDSGGGYTLQ
ncbi:response regulator transcription factor [Desulfurispira natronophila]|uniref:DNA-binding response OmpR family regulator n=1 Tax=Desulfurispira natronophila TaxID=682562 RepID=A0A7W7Y3H3_9BACT|nr:response regulator [Desulfurispira natronophila]MBB5021338.1 DNA-binding response OmpR family regulator [Desulfurispira natronophila]